MGGPQPEPGPEVRRVVEEDAARSVEQVGLGVANLVTASAHDLLLRVAQDDPDLGNRSYRDWLHRGPQAGISWGRLVGALMPHYLFDSYPAVLQCRQPPADRTRERYRLGRRRDRRVESTKVLATLQTASAMTQRINR